MGEGGGIKGTHEIIKVSLTFVKVVVHEDKYHIRVQRETSCKKRFAVSHFYSQTNE